MARLDEGFFEWLRSSNQLDKYEAALDLQDDYVNVLPEVRISAGNFVRRMQKEYDDIIEKD